MRENVNSFKVFKMVLELRKLQTDMQIINAVLSMRLKWCVFQPSKVKGSTRK